MSAPAEPGREPYPLAEPDASVADLASRLTDQVGDLVQSHVQLAKVEIVDEVKTASKGAGLFGGGAFAAYLAIVMLSFAAAWALSDVVPEGVAFAIVGILWAAVAAVLALMGRQEIQKVDPVPHRTVEEIKEDARWASEQTS